MGEFHVVILLTVRRFICGTADCPRRRFAEPFAQLTTPYARFTRRLNRALERFGLAPAGRAGSRLAAQLGLEAGRMTLLRRSWRCRIRRAALRGCWVWTRPPGTSATSARYSPIASAPRSPAGSTSSMPASCPASPVSHSICSETSTQ
ncbi:hypothetical protein [Streptomyces sp. NPDC002889]|uniref:hypothetical protein n=1 Tax=Streptomyces sp. NPDC002889 TaxID=3364669 RepID=UPI0036BC81E0